MNKPPAGIRDGRRFRWEKPWKAGFPEEDWKGGRMQGFSGLPPSTCEWQFCVSEPQSPKVSKSPLLGESLHEHCDKTRRSEENLLRYARSIATREESRP